MSDGLPFTWPQFERETGRELGTGIKKRLTACIRNPDPVTWEDARSIVVAPQMSAIGQTLWQCTEAVTLTRFPAGTVPSRQQVIMALCFAAGLPGPQ
jgi:hypothetical protein